MCGGVCGVSGVCMCVVWCGSVYVCVWCGVSDVWCVYVCGVCVWCVCV